MNACPSPLNPLNPPHLQAWLRLGTLSGVGRRTARQALTHFGSPETLFAQTTRALSDACGAHFAIAVQQAARDNAPGELQALTAMTLAWLAEPGHGILTLTDPAYPARLLTLADPPPLLYVSGNPQLLQRPALAIVGSRQPSAQGLDNAGFFASAMIRAGWSVVSGLALGIDARAHQYALTTSATVDASTHAPITATPAPQLPSTIAVIGTGIDQVYPARNRALSAAIAAGGAIISEWPLGTPPRAAHFPQRNRLIAALSHGVLVVEAGLRSGSLITARIANELGREVFAIPGSIHSPLSRGGHALIREGAKLVEEISDILEELPVQDTSALRPDSQASAAGVQEDASSTAHAATPGTSGTSADAALLAQMGHDPVSLLTLTIRCGTGADSVAAALSRLEIEGLIEQRGGRFQRTPAPDKRDRVHR